MEPLESTSKSRQKVSVIIPTYNNKESLKLVLLSLLYQDYPKASYEVIVVDDGGIDASEKVVAAMKKDFQISYYWQEDLGFRAGQARNLGASHASGEILIFVDDDTVVPSGFISSHVSMHPSWDVVLGYNSSYGVAESHDLLEIKKGLRQSNALSSIKLLPEFRKGWFDAARLANSASNPKLWNVFAAGNFSISKKLFLQFKFDEDFVGWAEEDIELGYRLQEAGKKIILSKECYGINIREKTPGTGAYMMTREKFISTTKNQLLLYSKHPSAAVKEYILRRYENTPESFRKGTFLDVEKKIFRVG